VHLRIGPAVDKVSLSILYAGLNKMNLGEVRVPASTLALTLSL
jgi:hypothetical protein